MWPGWEKRTRLGFPETFETLYRVSNNWDLLRVPSHLKQAGGRRISSALLRKQLDEKGTWNFRETFTRQRWNSSLKINSHQRRKRIHLTARPRMTIWLTFYSTKFFSRRIFNRRHGNSKLACCHSQILCGSYRKLARIRSERSGQ